MALFIFQEGVESTARPAWRLFGDYSFADPGFLVLLPVAVLLLLWGRARRGRPRGQVSILPLSPTRSARQRLMWIPGLFQLLALTLVILGLARPLRGNAYDEVTSEGVDIVLVLDRSGSMRFDDLAPERTRLDVVKEVVGDFASRRMGDREGAADNCALISFAHFPELLCPFTLDANSFRGFLENIEIVDNRPEDGTGIGIALAKAVAVLRQSEAKSKVAILLTDGENNIHDITPADAAELAAEEDIKVFTIYSARYQYVADPFRGLIPSSRGFDTSELENIAELTGGRFYHARDRSSLEAIYAEIEALERTERTEERFEENFDLYLWFLLPGLVLYGAGWLSTSTWARRVA